MCASVQVLDTCAAPGSKTAQMLEMLHASNAVPSGRSLTATGVTCVTGRLAAQSMHPHLVALTAPDKPVPFCMAPCILKA